VRLSPDQMIFWQHGFSNSTGTIRVHLGLMFVMGGRLETCHAQTVHRS